MNLGAAWPTDVCEAKTLTNIQISLPKDTKKIIRRFQENLATFLDS